jgi:hypothetical protein
MLSDVFHQSIRSRRGFREGAKLFQQFFVQWHAWDRGKYNPSSGNLGESRIQGFQRDSTLSVKRSAIRSAVKKIGGKKLGPEVAEKISGQPARSR